MFVPHRKKRSRCLSCMANQNNVFSKLLICLADIYFLLTVSLSLNLRFIAKSQKKNLEYIYILGCIHLVVERNHDMQWNKSFLAAYIISTDYF